jgi:murein DD-endopeptidase MepM/ murein hydrolase activator NlpD
VVVRWRGKNGSEAPALQGPGDPQAPLPSAGELAPIGFSEGGGPQPLSTPLTVPVSALMAGADGSFSLSSVFAITPRPGPVAGNGNRRLLFPLIGPAAISSGFGFRLHPVLGSWLMHAGKDFAAPEGTPVVAALGGRVVSSGMAGGYGLTVEVEHDNPRRRTLYAHLSELFVKTGDRVRQGEVIGRVGSTGMSTGPHLHFELRLPQDGGWVAVDPGDLDPGPAGIGVGNDAVALLMGQLLQRLERPQVQAQAPLQPQLQQLAPQAPGGARAGTQLPRSLMTD